MIRIVKVLIVKVCRNLESHLKSTGGVWVTTPFSNWKKAVEKMRDHKKSYVRSHAKEASLAAAELSRRDQSFSHSRELAGEKKRGKNEE